MATPAANMIALCQAGFAPKLRGSSRFYPSSPIIYKSAKGNPIDGIFRLPFLLADNFWRESQAEFFHLHAKKLSSREMPEFMDKYDYS
jgi:hypothetical protein